MWIFNCFGSECEFIATPIVFLTLATPIVITINNFPNYMIVVIMKTFLFELNVKFIQIKVFCLH